MESVRFWRGAVYRHIAPPRRLGPVECPVCQSRRVRWHSWRYRTVEHLDAERPAYLVLKLGKYGCTNPACARKSFTPPVAEAAPAAHTSRLLQQTATGLYRWGKAAVRDVEGQLREFWHTGTGKASVLRWHRQSLAHDFPRPDRLAFSEGLCIDEVYDRVGGKRQPIFTCVDPIAQITVRIPLERADAECLTAAMEQVRALGAAPRVIVSDLWAAYPEPGGPAPRLAARRAPTVLVPCHAVGHPQAGRVAQALWRNPARGATQGAQSLALPAAGLSPSPR